MFILRNINRHLCVLIDLLNPREISLMRFAFIIVLLTTISLSASAQWYHINIDLKKRVRLPLIACAQDNSVKQLQAGKLVPGKIPVLNLAQTDYSLEVAEEQIMKTAQHNMRFRIYDVASYNFSDLAKLYIKQNRFSEAKWYLLQSNSISRQENDDKHTIANLMDLALIKADMGDIALAQQDLAEARQLAAAKKWNDNVADIDKEVKYIQQNKTTASKTELRYADAVMNAQKGDKKSD